MDQVDWLLHHARRYPLLTAQQEIQLARQIQHWLALNAKPNKTNDELRLCRRGHRAYKKFFQSNIRLVVKCAGWYNRTSGCLAYEDLVGEGMLGLHHAIKKFDPSKGYKFSTYAVWWIRQAISRAIDTKASMIYMSGSAQQMARRAYRYICDEEARTGKRPALEEVAQRFNTSVANLRLYLAHSQNLISLDAPLQTSNKQDVCLLDVVEDPRSNLQVDELSELEVLLPKLMADLSDAEQDILKRRYLLHDRDTYETIAKDHGVSRERVRQVHDKAIRRMRHKLIRYGRAPEPAPMPRCA